MSTVVLLLPQRGGEAQRTSSALLQKSEVLSDVLSSCESVQLKVRVCVGLYGVYRCVPRAIEIICTCICTVKRGRTGFPSQYTMHVTPLLPALEPWLQVQGSADEWSTLLEHLEAADTASFSLQKAAMLLVRMCSQ